MKHKKNTNGNESNDKNQMLLDYKRENEKKNK